MPDRVSAPISLLMYSVMASRAALREVEQELSPLAEDSTQEARHGEDDVTMRDRLEHVFAQPFGPQDRALLLA